ncbi:hypothetical protein CspHIS471_0209520 [Cutaneotrichosporon sp. HIS471]|nr:hypothetical protein CspHIS471_0209520 [Cutaneotrichosporon sp. HIS471]
MSCGNENPCAKCVAAGAACSFSTSIGTSRTVLSTNEQPNRGDDQPHVSPSSGKRRAITSTPDADAPMRKRKVLNYENTAHFYMSSHGLSHHAGSTSGLPLLEATRRLMAEPAAQATDSNEPDWNWLQDLLQEGSPAEPTRNRSGGTDDTEYFPGRGLAPNTSDDQLLRMVSEIIPPDLMSELLRVFFSTVHPVWPILHIPSFFADLYRWDSHSFAALVVSMCMLASRYVDDPRVRKEASNPATAGLGYCDLFSRLIDHAIHSDNVIYAIQSRFFGSMFHSVDNVPHPVAQGLVADALSRSLDGGLHRSVSSTVLGSSILREIRARTAWAVYAWDHQIAAFCGRPAGSTLWDYDVRLPEPFEEDGSEQPIENDASHVATFCQLIQLSALLEAAFLASVQHPVVANSTFLTDLSRHLRPDLDDTYKLDKVMANLRKWRTTAPPQFSEASPKNRAAQRHYSVATEQIAALDQMIQLMVASRHLQLETLSAEPAKDKLESFRATILTHARDMTAIVVQLGASNQLAKCDIMVAYRLLFTGRLLLACILSARSESNSSQVEEATKILHATSVVLRHFVSVFSVALGAAEVLDETIRVCRVPTPQAATRGNQPSTNRYAWYRPIIHHDSKAAPSPSAYAHAQPSSSHDGATGSAPPDVSLATTLSMNDLSPFDVSFAFGGNMPMPTFDQADGAHGGETDFLWLLPGGEANLPYYFPPSV